MSHHMHSLVPALLPTTTAVRLDDVTVTTDLVLLSLTATAATPICPLCVTPSTTFHCRYQRQPTDVPCFSLQVRMQLTVRKFVCHNPDCARHICSERLPDLVESYARTTTRLVTTLRHIGLALGGQAGARLAKQVHYPTSPATLRRLFFAPRFRLRRPRPPSGLTSGSGAAATSLARSSSI
jgi:transposase